MKQYHRPMIESTTEETVFQNYCSSSRI